MSEIRHPFEPRPIPRPADQRDHDHDPVAVGIFLGLLLVCMILASFPVVLDFLASHAPAVDEELAR